MSAANIAAMVPLDGAARLPPAVIGAKACAIDTMQRLDLPVPPAFCVPQWVCRQHLYAPRTPGLREAVLDGLTWLQEQADPTRGAGSRPLSVSVRSSPAQSMPGMLDTVLNVVDVDALHDAVLTVLASWNSPRAVAYRRHRHLDDAAGTAVVVQSMVFGNRDERSGAGVVFSRNPLTGADELFGDWRWKSQGDEVVSGTADCVPISALARHSPDVYQELTAAARKLERHYTDMQDIEFTVEAGRLWLLQTRTATRSPRAALRVALTLLEEGVIDDAEVVRRITPQHLEAMRSASLRPEVRHSATLLATGIAAAPGVVSGRAYCDVDEAVVAAQHEDVILVRTATSPGDVTGMLASTGVVTEMGGAASHAAVISRELGRPAVVGCGAGVAATLAGKLITVDGTAGEVFEGLLEAFDDGGAGNSETADLQAYQAIVRRVDDCRGDEGETASGDFELRLLQTLRLKSRVATTDVAGLIGQSPDSAAVLVGDLVNMGLLTGTTTLRLTPHGRDRLTQLLTAERAGADITSIMSAYNAFRAINTEFKALVTDWQLKDGTPNAHDDEQYDSAVITRLDDIHRRVVPVIDTVAAQLPRLASYGAKLQHALERVHGGERQWLTRPLIDSYHSVWFELHEELIVAAGLTRADEARAGHAQ